jgi:general stress protein 26
MSTVKLLYRLNLLFFIFMLAGGCSNKAEQKPNELSHEEIALEIIKASGTCTLITVDSVGQPRARIMDPFPPEDNFAIWFGTNSNSRKVDEIHQNNRATVNYYDKATASYVSLYGTAEIVNDPEITKKYWKAAWNDFYPDYPKGYTLIKVVPKRIELLSEAHGILGDSITWQPTVILLD